MVGEDSLIVGTGRDFFTHHPDAAGYTAGNARFFIGPYQFHWMEFLPVNAGRTTDELCNYIYFE